MNTYRVAYVQEPDGQTLAVFPESTPDCRDGRILTYGSDEHGEVDIDWIKEQPLADNYDQLHRRLEALYGPSGPAASAGASAPVQLVVDQNAIANL
ncbi:hypothetical protein [Gordonia sihwensis]|uniref:hypothetical protein n=1 Tax=Gordonia sihwensis TaxID=173559 RepID=UPI003D9819BD